MSDGTHVTHGELKTDFRSGLVMWREFGRGDRVALVDLGRPASEAEMTGLRAEHETVLAEREPGSCDGSRHS